MTKVCKIFIMKNNQLLQIKKKQFCNNNIYVYLRYKNKHIVELQLEKFI